MNDNDQLPHTGETTPQQDLRPLEDLMREHLDLVDEAVGRITDDEVEQELRRAFEAAGVDRVSRALDVPPSPTPVPRRRRRPPRDEPPAPAPRRRAVRVGGSARPRRERAVRATRMVGREDSIAALDEVIEDGVRGKAGVTVISGEPGVGKTTLLNEFVDRARERLTVARGGAGEIDRTAPLSTLRSALRACPPIREKIDQIVTEDPAAFASQVADVLDTYAVTERLVMVIDDAHRVDEASAAAITQLASSSSPVQWLLACRPPERPTPGAGMVAWLRRRGVREIEVPALTLADVVELCANLLGAQPDSGLRAVLRRAHGSPLAVEQLLGGLRAARRLERTGNVVRLTDGEVPDHFEDAIRLRLEHVRPLTRSLLEAGSIFSRPFTVDGVARLIKERAGGLATARSHAVRMGLLQDDGQVLRFCHDRVREAVYELVDEPRRRSMHQAAVDVVQREGGSLAEAAEHVLFSGRRDRDAVELLRAAAREITGVAPRTAAAYLLSALDILGVRHPLWPEVCAEALKPLILADRLAGAQKLGEAALGRGLSDETKAKVLAGLAWALRQQGHLDAAIAYARRASEAESAPNSIRARAYAVKASILAYLGDITDADHAGAEAHRLAGTDDPTASVNGNGARSVAARRGGWFGEALRHADRAIGMADRFEGESARRYPRIWRCGVLLSLDRFADAEADHSAIYKDTNRLGSLWVLPYWHFEKATLLYAQGRLDDAVAVAESGLMVADQIATRQLSVPLLGLLAAISIERGDLAMAEECLDRRRRLMDEDRISAARDLVAWPVAALHEARGDPGAALDSLEPIFDELAQGFLLFAHDPGCAPAMVRIARAAGDHDRADRAATAARLLADRNPGVTSLLGAALRAEGLNRQDVGALSAAVACLRDGGRPLLLAGALEDLASVEHRAGRPGPAIEHGQQALEIYRRRGARGAAVRLGRRQPDLDTVAAAGQVEDAGSLVGLDKLTPTERDVARLVAGGATRGRIAERLRTSTYTVDTYVRHIYDKLGLRSHVELSEIVEAETRRRPWVGGSRPGTQDSLDHGPGVPGGRRS